MKKIKKSAIGLLMGGMLLGGGATYAASNWATNLDQIKDDFNFTLNFAKNKQQEAKDLQNQLNGASSDKERLEGDILSLQQQIERIRTDNAIEITNKNQEIANKQAEINAKQEEVNQKQSAINDLNNQLGKLNGQVSQMEARISELANHTGSAVQELSGQ